MAKSRHSFRVGISGSYGGLNLGDEAILKGIVKELRRALPVEITVFSRDAEDTRQRHEVERVVPVRKLSRDEVLPEVQRLDLLILGGGGILFDGEAQIFLREVMLAHEHRVPVMVYAVSAGPLRDPAVQRAGRGRAEPRRGGHRARARRPPGPRGHRRCTARSWSPPTRRCCSSPTPLAEGRAQARGPRQRPPSGRHVGARARRRGARHQRAGLSQAPGRRRRLHGRPLRRRRRVRADGAQDDGRPALPCGGRADAARAARDGAQGRLHLGAAARADRAVRLRGRHAAALPDLREPAERAVRGAALRAQGRRLPRGPQDRDAALAAGQRRPPDRLHRPRLGPAASSCRRGSAARCRRCASARWRATRSRCAC